MGPTFVGTITKTFVECTDLMIKTSAFLIDILELQLSIWKSNFILEMASATTVFQNLELFPYTHKIDLL